MVLDSKTCQECKKSFQSKDSKRKFCSRSCAASFNNRKAPKRKRRIIANCVNCSKPTSNKKFCSIGCQHEHQEANRISKWLAGEIEGGSLHTLYAFVKRYLRRKQGGACAICGNIEWLGLPILLIGDHIDGDPTDHRPENVRLICSNCDATLPTYKAKNKGSGRAYRRTCS